MRAVVLLGRALRAHPVAAIWKLARDYFTYIGMCVFCLLILILRRPLSWWDRRHQEPGVRHTLIEATARIARA